MMKEITRRLKRISGDFSPDCLWQLDNEHTLVKPNSFTNAGILLDGEVVSGISYGGIGVVPVAMSYGLDENQRKQVLDQCLIQAKRLIPLLKNRSYMVAREIANEISEELCACLQPLRENSDKTLADIIKKMSLKSRNKYIQIMKILKRVPDFVPAKKIGLSIHPLYQTKGSLSSKFKQQNHQLLLADARKSFIPYLTDSAIEQDHYGLRKMMESDLIVPQDEFKERRSRIPFSKMHIHGINTLPMRAGFEPGVPFDKKIDPLKKKKIFEKAQRVFGYLEENDDPKVLEAFGKLVNYLQFDQDDVDYGRLVISDNQTDPFVVPIIVEEPETKRYPIDYKPLQALDIMDAKMQPSDFMGSTNRRPGADHIPFPFGSDMPLAPPSRIRPEYK